MNVKSTIILLIVAVVLAVYFTLTGVEPGGPDAGDRPGGGEAARGRPFVEGEAINPSAVERVTVERPGEPAALFERGDEGRWRQAAPVAWDVKGPDAGGFNIGKLIDAAVALRYTRAISEPEPAEVYELDPPRATLRIEGARLRFEGRLYANEAELRAAYPGRADRVVDEAERRPVQLTFKLGRPSGAGRAFVGFGEASTVYVADRDLHRLLLDRPLSDLRERSLARIALGRVERVELHRDGTTIAMARGVARRPVGERGDGEAEPGPGDDGPAGRGVGNASTWRFVVGASGRASEEKIEELVNVIGTATIEAFVADRPESLETFGLDDGGEVLVVEGRSLDGGSTQHRLRIGRRTVEGDSRYAMFGRTPVVFTLPDYAVEVLDEPVEAFRDGRLTPSPRGELRRIEVERPGKPTLALAMAAGRWGFAEPRPAFRVEPDSVEALLDAVFDRRADAFRPAGEASSPHTTVKLDFAAGAGSEVLRIADAEGEGRIVVHRVGEPVAAVLDRSELAALWEPMRFYKDRRVRWSEAGGPVVAARVVWTGPFAVDHPWLSRTVEGEGGPTPLEIDDEALDRLKDDVEAPGRWVEGAAEGFGEWVVPEGLRRGAVEALAGRLSRLRAARWLERPPDDERAPLTITVLCAAGSPEGAGEPELTRKRLRVYPDLRIASVDGEAFELSSPAMSELTAELRRRTVVPLEVGEIGRVTTANGVSVERGGDGRYAWPEGAEMSEQRAGELFDALAGLQADRFFGEHVEFEGDPAATLVIEPRGGAGEPLTLQLFKPAQTPADQYAGRIGRTSFTLQRPTALKLLPPEQAQPSTLR